jgi:hypothetical protein
MRHRPLALALLAAAALALTGCIGHKNTNVTEAQTEGLYMDVGPLLYQVQISRYLNPADPEDAEYLTGLPQGTSAQLPKGQVWFGVWMRVQNVGKQAQTATSQYEITDTQGNDYRPIPLNTNINPFAYVASQVGPGEFIPGPETAAYNGPIQGSLLLFKLNNASLQNRPLTLKIEGGAGQEATVQLDL